MIDRVLANNEDFGGVKHTLSFSCSELMLETCTGKIVQGSFKIIADDSARAEGYVYCSDLRMVIRTASFGGLDMEILFQYDATGIEPGSICNGKICVISNCGEYEIPYTVTVTSAVPVSSLGMVKNLFHFTNLVQSNESEAARLFYSGQFTHVLDGIEKDYLNIYRGYAGSYDNLNNVDKFLEATKKKVRLDYNTDVSDILVTDPEQSVSRTINIIPAGWGRITIDVSTEGDFISCDQTVINQDDISNGVYGLEIFIDREQLHKGKNCGAVILSDFYKTVRIPVTVNCNFIKGSHKENKRMLRQDLTNQYISFRLGDINKNEFFKKTGSIIGMLIQLEPDDIESRLYQAHLFLMEKRFEDANKILTRIGNLLDEEEHMPELFGYYYYLMSIYSKDDEHMQEMSEQAELLYVQNINSWRLAWTVLHMSDQYINDEYNSWGLIRQQFEYGIASPVMYLEALTCVLKSPQVLQELGDFEISFLMFCKRRGVLARELRNRFVFLASRLTGYSAEIYELLVHCYEQEPKDETLEAICLALMKGNLRGEEYFKWYEKAVDHELRIKRLYEYFIMSIDLDYEGALPKLILMYFAYRSNLDYERAAFLYSNVLKHKKEYNDIYKDYIPAMEAFAEDMFFKERLNENLAYIYECILGDKLLEPEYASIYSKMVFMNTITVTKPEIINVVIVNGALLKERVYPVYNRTVIAPVIYKEDFIFLEDEAGNRYFDESLYSLKCIIERPYKLVQVMENAIPNIIQALYVAYCSGETLRADAVNAPILMWLSESPEINETYRICLMIELLEFYFEQDEISIIDELLGRFEPDKLEGKQFESCVRIMVARGMYDKAFDWVRTYGMEQVDYKILVRLCDRMLVRTDFEYDPDLLKICEGIFELGKYDETILEYLLLYKQGLTANLKGLWRAADSFGLDVHHLLENMITQILYTGIEAGEEANIFNEYVKAGSVTALESRFLTMLAYKYFVEKIRCDESVFDRVERLFEAGEDISDYCKIAYMKVYANMYKHRGLDAQKRALISVFIKELSAKHIFLPFFLDYAGLWPRFNLLTDRCFIEYKAVPGNRVIIHYVVDKGDNFEDEYHKEEMTHMIGGIYVNSFILFYGERIRYYITEEGARSEKLTKSDQITKNEISGDKNEYRYNLINNIIASKDMHDDATFCNIAHEYSKKSYLVNRLFVPRNQ